jgi:hypothetical protein
LAIPLYWGNALMWRALGVEGVGIRHTRGMLWHEARACMVGSTRAIGGTLEIIL